jgi:membrane fusion protein, multidrug efflux system
VKKGDVLAHIDPVTYQAQYDQALAKKALDEALLANSKRDLDRYTKVGTLAISQQQIDTQRALVAQQEAQVKSDQAAINNVHAILGYTNVVAPIDGRTGLRQIDVGNIVRTSDTPIVTLTEIRPISVMFTLPQQQLPEIKHASARSCTSKHSRRATRPSSTPASCRSSTTRSTRRRARSG